MANESIIKQRGSYLKIVYAPKRVFLRRGLGWRSLLSVGYANELGRSLIRTDVRIFTRSGGVLSKKIASID
jgi:hypothetical protein